MGSDSPVPLNLDVQVHNLELYKNMYKGTQMIVILEHRNSLMSYNTENVNKKQHHKIVVLNVPVQKSGNWPTYFWILPFT